MKMAELLFLEVYIFILKSSFIFVSFINKSIACGCQRSAVAAFRKF